MAATIMENINAKKLIFINSGFVAHNRPEMNTKLSPGRKKPTNKPVSAKITNKSKATPP
jgi:hypothetical protein